jgi:hypothetical protein
MSRQRKPGRSYLPLSKTVTRYDKGASCERLVICMGLLRRLRSRRRKPFVHVGRGLGLPGLAHKFFTPDASRKAFGLFAQIGGFRRKPVFKCLQLFDTAPHDTAPCLSGRERNRAISSQIKATGRAVIQLQRINGVGGSVRLCTQFELGHCARKQASTLAKRTYCERGTKVVQSFHTLKNCSIHIAVCPARESPP